VSEPFDVMPPDFSDAGNANRFSVWYRGLLAYTDALGWLWWNGRKWEANDHKAAEKAVKLTEEMLLDALGELSTSLHAEAEAKALVASKEEGAAEALKKAKEAVNAASLPYSRPALQRSGADWRHTGACKA
jgi:putative DNA primase/helicase